MSDVETKLATGLRTFCSREQCKTIEVTATANYTAGQILKYEGVVGVVAADVALGATAVLIYEAPDIEVACEAVGVGGAYVPGSAVYYDAAAGKVTQTATGNTFCGVVMVLPTPAAEKVRISLVGVHSDFDTDTDTDTDEYVASVEFAAAGIGGAFFIAPVACEVVSAFEVHGTKAGQAGTLQIEKCTSGEAAGEGDAVLATAFNLAGDNLVPQTSLAVADGKEQLAAGDVLRTKLADGNAATLAAAVVSVRIRRL